MYAYSANSTTTLPGTDCRVCRINGDLICHLWGGPSLYGPLCESKTCPQGKSWLDGPQGCEGCYCDWGIKQHERMPCPTPVSLTFPFHRQGLGIRGMEGMEADKWIVGWGL